LFIKYFFNRTVDHPWSVEVLQLCIYWKLRLTVSFTGTTFGSRNPIVVAVVISGPFAVVQQTVSALFQCQCSICAQVKLITIVGMRVRLFADLFRTLRRLFCAVILTKDHWKISHGKRFILKSDHQSKCLDINNVFLTSRYD